jgi:hypothetical protein
MSSANLLRSDNKQLFNESYHEVVLKSAEIEVIKPVLFPINTKIGIEGDLEMIGNVGLDFDNGVKISSKGINLIETDLSNNLLLNDISNIYFSNNTDYFTKNLSLDVSINSLKTDISNETQARINADNNINNLLGNANSRLISLENTVPNKYDKTGGLINGNVDISGNLTFDKLDLGNENLDISGSSLLSGSSGISSVQFLRIIINGTPYKIALNDDE